MADVYRQTFDTLSKEEKAALTAEMKAELDDLDQGSSGESILKVVPKALNQFSALVSSGLFTDFNRTLT